MSTINSLFRPTIVTTKRANRPNLFSYFEDLPEVLYRFYFTPNGNFLGLSPLQTQPMLHEPTNYFTSNASFQAYIQVHTNDKAITNMVATYAYLLTSAVPYSVLKQDSFAAFKTNLPFELTNTYVTLWTRSDAGTNTVINSGTSPTQTSLPQITIPTGNVIQYFDISGNWVADSRYVNALVYQSVIPEQHWQYYTDYLFDIQVGVSDHPYLVVGPVPDYYVSDGKPETKKYIAFKEVLSNKHFPLVDYSNLLLPAGVVPLNYFQGNTDLLIIQALET
jgi:hypothetical protein